MRKASYLGWATSPLLVLFLAVLLVSCSQLNNPLAQQPTPTGVQVHGRVLTAHGDPLETAAVLLITTVTDGQRATDLSSATGESDVEGAVAGSTLTDASGTFVFTDVRHGHYLLQIHKDGYAPSSTPLDITPDYVSVDASVQLKPAEDDADDGAPTDVPGTDPDDGTPSSPNDEGDAAGEPTDGQTERDDDQGSGEGSEDDSDHGTDDGDAGDDQQGPVDGPSSPSDEDPTPPEGPPPGSGDSPAEEPADPPTTPEPPAQEPPTPPPPPDAEPPVTDPPAPDEPPPPPATNPGAVQLAFDNTVPASYRAALTAAANRWSDVIVGQQPAVSIGQPVSCNGVTSPGNVVVNGALILVAVEDLGNPNLLGYAGPCYLRSSNGLPVVGVIVLNKGIDDAYGTSTLEQTALHEMGHVLGLGTLWQRHGLMTAQPMSSCDGGAFVQDPAYVGSKAVAAYRSFPGRADAVSVPLESTMGAGSNCGHWDARALPREIMVGTLTNSRHSLSKATVGSLADLGYTVNTNAADPYDPGAIRPYGLEGGPELEDRLVYPVGYL